MFCIITFFFFYLFSGFLLRSVNSGKQFFCHLAFLSSPASMSMHTYTNINTFCEDIKWRVLTPSLLVYSGIYGKNDGLNDDLLENEFSHTLVHNIIWSTCIEMQRADEKSSKPAYYHHNHLISR